MAVSFEERLKSELGTLVYQCLLREYQLGVATDEIHKLRALLPKDQAEPAKPDPTVTPRRTPKARHA